MIVLRDVHCTRQTQAQSDVYRWAGGQRRDMARQTVNLEELRAANRAGLALAVRGEMTKRALKSVGDFHAFRAFTRIQRYLRRPRTQTTNENNQAIWRDSRDERTQERHAKATSTAISAPQGQRPSNAEPYLFRPTASSPGQTDGAEQPPPGTQTKKLQSRMNIRWNTITFCANNIKTVAIRTISSETRTPVAASTTCR